LDEREIIYFHVSKIKKEAFIRTHYILDLRGTAHCEADKTAT
jgi:hypothetical protein